MTDSVGAAQSPSDPLTTALQFEDRDWIPMSAVPRRRRFDYSAPYRAAVPPRIAGTSLPVPIDVLALAENASTEIARFDAELGSEIAPFAPLLLRSESAASSKIENLTASAKSIALAELGDRSRRNASIIVANTRAMQAALRLAEQVNEQTILDMHEALLGDTHPGWVGHWRNQQVWIGGTDYGPHDAAFVPPHHDRIPEAMADLVAFMDRDDLPPLVQATIAHAQFETIHPFPDGNGRTGRALIHSLLRAKGLTRNVTVPVSAGLLTDTAAYFDSLGEYRNGRPSVIIELFAEASFAAINNGRQLVDELRGIRSRWSDVVVGRRGAAVWKVADLLVRQPVIDSALAQHALGVAATNINSAIERLVQAGVLTKVGGNVRNKQWMAGEVIRALDRFAERAGRRH